MLNELLIETVTTEHSLSTPLSADDALRQTFQQLRTHIEQHVVGQPRLIERLLIALLADGHLLVEGAPGLAKTTAIKTLARYIEGDFHRLQFTPDLLPADLIGTDIFRVQTGEFEFQPGPMFHNVLLADEINRAPAKVQSALLEAMAERQITVGRSTYPLPPLFLVMATQNPIEQEGTFPLPEAQLDRFLLYVRIGYPDAEAERQILALARRPPATEPDAEFRIKQSQLFAARQALGQVHLAPVLEDYLIQLVLATREPAQHAPELAPWISYGVSPRGTIALERCARAHAWLAGRDYVSPEDIHAVAHDVLRHRLLVSFEAEAAGIDADHILDRLLQWVAVP